MPAPKARDRVRFPATGGVAASRSDRAGQASLEGTDLRREAAEGTPR